MWVVLGVDVLANPSPVSAFLGRAYHLEDHRTAMAMALSFGSVECLIGFGLAAKRLAKLAAHMGAALTAAMLAAALLVFESMRGADCGCLRLFGITNFGWYNVLFLCGSLTVFVGVAVRLVQGVPLVGIKNPCG
jgi:hypothetical protein